MNQMDLSGFQMIIYTPKIDLNMLNENDLNKIIVLSE